MTTAKSRDIITTVVKTTAGNYETKLFQMTVKVKQMLHFTANIPQIYGRITKHRKFAEQIICCLLFLSPKMKFEGFKTLKTSINKTYTEQE